MKDFDMNPELMDFTEVLREWLHLDTQRGMNREETERHWQLEQEINRRAPKEDFT
jgi:hypothetical protein